MLALTIWLNVALPIVVFTAKLFDKRVTGTSTIPAAILSVHTVATRAI